MGKKRKMLGESNVEGLVDRMQGVINQETPAYVYMTELTKKGRRPVRRLRRVVMMQNRARK